MSYDPERHAELLVQERDTARARIAELEAELAERDHRLSASVWREAQLQARVARALALCEEWSTHLGQYWAPEMLRDALIAALTEDPE